MIWLHFIFHIIVYLLLLLSSVYSTLSPNIPFMLVHLLFLSLHNFIFFFACLFLSFFKNFRHFRLLRLVCLLLRSAVHTSPSNGPLDDVSPFHFFTDHQTSSASTTPLHVLIPSLVTDSLHPSAALPTRSLHQCKRPLIVLTHAPVISLLSSLNCPSLPLYRLSRPVRPSISYMSVPCPWSSRSLFPTKARLYPSTGHRPLPPSLKSFSHLASFFLTLPVSTSDPEPVFRQIKSLHYSSLPLQS